MTGAKRQSRIRMIQLISVFLLLFLLIFILGTESARVSAEVGKETVCRETVTHTLRAGAYLFRDEVQVTDRNSGPVHYLKTDGEAVRAGEALADVYRDDTGTDKRERAAVLYTELELLEQALSQDEEAWQLTYLRAYDALTAAASRGGISYNEASARVLTASLLRKEAATGNTAAIETRIAELNASLSALVEYVGEPDTVLAGADGIFYRQADGYESVFTCAAAFGLTPEGLRLLIAEKSAASGDMPEAIGKVVSGGAFSLVIPTTAEEAVFFPVGETYAVIFEKDSLTMDMQLTSVTLSADGSEALLQFLAEKAPPLADAVRYRSVRVEGERVTGLSVPETAMRVENNRDGVYILSNGVASWRPVKILYRADGCCLVAPGHPEESGSAVPELAAGDVLIVTGRRIYEGKALNG